VQPVRIEPGVCAGLLDGHVGIAADHRGCAASSLRCHLQFFRHRAGFAGNNGTPEILIGGNNGTNQRVDASLTGTSRPGSSTGARSHGGLSVPPLIRGGERLSGKAQQRAGADPARGRLEREVAPYSAAISATMARPSPLPCPGEFGIR